jgi:hypothetical protein
LLESDRSVVFSLSSSRSGDSVKTFTLSYSTVFDLEITYPFVDTSSRYFPLKRASRPEQYVLGRAFLQETHLIVDYDQGYFTLSQAKGNADGPDLVSLPTEPADAIANRTPSTGTYVRIGTGTLVAAILVGLLVLAWVKRRWPFKFRRSFESSKTLHQKPELHDEPVPRVEAMGKERAELETREARLEMFAAVDCQQQVHGLDLLHEIGVNEHGGTQNGTRAAAGELRQHSLIS